MKLLLVEDHEAILLGLEYLLNEEGYACTAAGSYAEARECCEREEYDLALLDIALPDGSGYELCRELKKDQGIPVIFLTAKDEEDDVVQGFELGADDYIQKPFRNRELLSRIQNVLRRCGKTSEILHCGYLRLNTRTGLCYSHEQEVQLTPLEYKILSSLMSYPGKLFTRDEILASIWDNAGNFVNDNTLTVTIKRIREKIGDKDGTLLKTVRGMGYRMEK